MKGFGDFDYRYDEENEDLRREALMFSLHKGNQKLALQPLVDLLFEEFLFEIGLAFVSELVELRSSATGDIEHLYHFGVAGTESVHRIRVDVGGIHFTEVDCKQVLQE